MKRNKIVNLNDYRRRLPQSRDPNGLKLVREGVVIRVECSTWPGSTTKNYTELYSIMQEVDNLLREVPETPTAQGDFEEWLSKLEKLSITELIERLVRSKEVRERRKQCRPEEDLWMELNIYYQCLVMEIRYRLNPPPTNP